MAPLTWRNVDAPDFGRAAEILNAAAQNFSGGFSGLSGALDKARGIQKENRSAALIDDIAKIRGESGVDPFLNNLPGMIRDRDMTRELQQTILGLRGNAMGFDSERLKQDGIRARTAATRAASARAGAAAARQKRAEEALQAAGVDLLSVRAAANKGDERLPGEMVLPDFNPETGEVGELPLTLRDAGVHTQDAVVDIMRNNPDIKVEDLLTFMDRTGDRWNTAATDLDANRERDTKANRSAEAERVAEEARALTAAARSSSLDEGEWASFIQNAPVSEEVKQTAFGNIDAELLGLLNSSGEGQVNRPENAAEVQRALEMAAADAAAELSGDDAIRVNDRAIQEYSNSDPALLLQERMGLTDMTPAQITERINQVRVGLKEEEGIEISPAEAAALLEENGYRSRLGRWDGIGWGDLGVDAKAAIKQGARLLSDEGRRGAESRRFTVEQRQAQITAVQNEITQLEAQIVAARRRGMEGRAQAMEARLEQLQNQWLAAEAQRASGQ